MADSAERAASRWMGTHAEQAGRLAAVCVRAAKYDGDGVYQQSTDCAIPNRAGPAYPDGTCPSAQAC